MPPKVEEAEEVVAASRAFRNHKGRVAALVTLIGAVCTGLAVTVVPIVTTYLNRPPAPKSNVEEVLKALKEESERKDKEIRQIHDDMNEMRAWWKGYLTAQGMNVTDPPDTNTPGTTVVEIRPKPLMSRKNAAPRPTVETPLPVPKPLGHPGAIPEPFAPQQQ